MSGQSQPSTVAEAERGYRRLVTWWFAAAYAPFYLNDVLFLVVESWSVATAIDYATRILVLLILVAHPALRELSLKPENPRWSTASLCIGAVAALGLMVTLYYGKFWLLPDWMYSDGMGVYLPVDSWPLYLFDMVAGLALVAVSEELLGRRVTYRVLSLYTSRRWIIVTVSVVIFGLMHWSNGADNVVTACAAGVVFMMLYLRSGSLWPCIAVHYVYNFLVFSGFLRSYLPAS